MTKLQSAMPLRFLWPFSKAAEEVGHGGLRGALQPRHEGHALGAHATHARGRDRVGQDRGLLGLLQLRAGQMTISKSCVHLAAQVFTMFGLMELAQAVESGTLSLEQAPDALVSCEEV